MIYAVNHITKVSYDSMVRLARFNLRLKPANWHTQKLLDYKLVVAPNADEIRENIGPYVVNVARIAINEPLKELLVTSTFKVEIYPRVSDEALQKSPDVQSLRNQVLQSDDLFKLTPASYVYPSDLAPLNCDIMEWARPMVEGAVNIADAATKVMQAIYKEFKYDSKATSIDTKAIDAFNGRHGVCQDFAHIMIIALRGHGIPAAYISGYLRTLPPVGKPKLVGADATHAWVSVWCGNDLGWVGFDPTNNCLAGKDHIFTAMGRDYADVAPVDGVFFGYSRQTMKVSVDVSELNPDELGQEGLDPVLV